MNGDILRGKIALMYRGLDFAVGQLANAHFKKVFADDCSESLEMLLEEMTKEDDGSGDEDGEYLDEVQQEEEDAEEEESEDEGNFMDYVRRNCTHSELDCYRTVMWKYPEEFRQSSVDGRSESNACSVIALVIAYNFVTEGFILCGGWCYLSLVVNCTVPSNANGKQCV